MSTREQIKKATFNSCAQFVEPLFPHWDELTISPITGLKTTIASCAARAITASCYLELNGIQPHLAYNRYHGDIHARTGDLIVGHMIAVDASASSVLKRVIDSDYTAAVWSDLMHVDELNRRFCVASPGDAITEYCESIDMWPDFTLSDVQSVVSEELAKQL